MISGLKSPGASSLPSFRPVRSEGGQTPAVGQEGLKDLKGALKDLSHNPIVRSLLGESGFDGVKGKGHAHHGHKADKADKAGKPEEGQATSEDAVKQLVDGLKKFVELLQQVLGKKNETQDGTKAAGGSEGAKGAEGAQEAQAADGADKAQEAKDPISKLLETLKKIIDQLEQLQASMAQQGQNTGIVPPGATQGENTGIVPPTISQGENTGIVPPDMFAEI